MKHFILLAIIFGLSTARVNIISFFAWRAFNLSSHSGEKSNGDLGGIFYSPENAVVGDIAVYRDRLFISFPKSSNIRVTLTSLRYESELQSPPLQPFPSLKMHKEGDCATLQNVKDIEVDSRGHLWVVDQNWGKCRSSRIWIFNLNDNDVDVLVHDIPVYSSPYFKMDLGSLALYEEENDVYAFILEENYRRVIVFSLNSKETWFVGMIGGSPLSGMAVSSVGENKLLYLSSRGRTEPAVYTILVSDLIERKKNVLTPSLVANKTSVSLRLVMDRKGILYFDLRGDTAVGSWNTNYSFWQGVAFRDDKQLSPVRWYARFTVDERDDVWFLIRFDGGFELLKTEVVIAPTEVEYVYESSYEYDEYDAPEDN